MPICPQKLAQFLNSVNIYDYEPWTTKNMKHNTSGVTRHSIKTNKVCIKIFKNLKRVNVLLLASSLQEMIRTNVLEHKILSIFIIYTNILQLSSCSILPTVGQNRKKLQFKNSSHITICFLKTQIIVFQFFTNKLV